MGTKGTSPTSVVGLGLLLLIVALSVPAARAAAPDAQEQAPPLDPQLTVLATGEIPELRSRTTRTFLRERSTYELQAFTRSVNYQDAEGRWQPIDSGLVPSLRPGYALRNKANRYLLELPSSLALAPVRIEERGRFLSFALEGAAGVLEPAGGGAASYRQALPNVTVRYEAEPDSVKETLVLERPEAASSFRFAVSASAGLTASLERGGVSFRDRSGETVFSFAPPFLVDAAGERSERVSFALERTGSGWTLTLRADRTWLAAPGRRYPVALDPTTFLGPWSGATPFTTPASDCTLKSGQPDTSFCSESVLEVGSEAGSTRRALLRFDILTQQLPAMANVLSASLGLKVQQAPASSVVLSAHKLTAAWTQAATWNRRDGTNAWQQAGGDFDPTALSTQTLGPGSTGYVFWRVTAQAQRWVDGETQHGLLVKAQTETGAPLTRFVANTNASGSLLEGDPHLSIRYRQRTGALRQYSFDSHELSERQSLGVNLANANVLVEATDLAIAGTGLDLELGRFYNSRDFPFLSGGQEALGSIGRGWTLSVGPDVGLELYPFDGGSAVFYGPSGFAVHFPKKQDGSGFEAPLHGLEAKLAQLGSEYVLTMNRSAHTYVFNASGFLIREEDRNGNAIRYAYDAQNRLTQITDTQDRVVTAAYNPQGLIESLTDWSGRVVRYGYDAQKRLTSVTDPAGKVTSYAYNGNHQLTKITDPLLQETRITYFAGSQDRYEVSVTRVTDPQTGAGPRTLYQTCPRGQELCPPTEEAYWEPNQPRTLVTDPNNNKTLFYTDVHSRVHKLKDALMRVQSTLDLNENHDVKTDTTFLQHVWTNRYGEDGNFNLETTKLPADTDEVTERWRYQNSNHPFLATEHTDPQGNITGYGYDSKGNLETVTNALQRTARTHYNANGTVDGALDFKGVVNHACDAHVPGPVTVCYFYDAKGNLTRVDNSEPLGDWSYDYDDLSRVETVTDGKGQVTTFAYDALDRITSITYPGPLTIAYTYDANGNVLTMTDNTGTTVYEYDKLNRLKKETLPGPKVNEYGYDLGGNLTAFTDAGGTVTYVYNGVNNVTDIIEPGTPPGTLPIKIAYHDDHLRKRITYPNGITQCFWYDASDRIKFAWSQRNDDVCPATPPAGRITGYEYEYSEAGEDTGLIQKVTDKAGNVTVYDYDELNRLVTAVTSGGPNAKSFAYSYDHNSNRLTETVDTDPATTYAYHEHSDQLLSAGSTSFTYDGNGNELTASNRRTSTYNAKDQLDSLTPQGQSAIPMTYTDTGQFKRVTRGSTSFTNSGLGLTRENTTSFTRDPDGFVLGQRTPTRTYFLHDGLGSVVATTNEAGQESLIARYAPFGTCLANCPTVPYRWLGGLGVYWDQPLQLHKMGTRYYDATLGRFTQVDPVAGGSANRYDYAFQDPINGVDLRGTQRTAPCSFLRCVDAAKPIRKAAKNRYVRACLGSGAVGAVFGIVGGPPGAAKGAVGGCAEGLFIETIERQGYPTLARVLNYAFLSASGYSAGTELANRVGPRIGKYVRRKLVEAFGF
jgi:RHS repeat-associated protein